MHEWKIYVNFYTCIFCFLTTFVADLIYARVFMRRNDEKQQFNFNINTNKFSL